MALDQSDSDSLSISGVFAPGGTTPLSVPTGPPKLPPQPPTQPPALPAVTQSAATTTAITTPTIESIPREVDARDDDAPSGRIGACWLGLRLWFATQGVWWLASAVSHAVVLVATLLLLGVAVSDAKIHSVAPGFEAVAGVETALGEPADLESFNSPMEPTNIEPDDASSVSGGGIDAATMTIGRNDGPGGGDDSRGESSSRPGGLGTANGFVSSGGGNWRGFTTDMKSLLQPTHVRGSLRMNVGDGRPPRRPSSARLGGVKNAKDVRGAVGSVLSNINRELETGDLLVVWLVDGSISLVDDRQKVAEHVEPFFREIEQRGKGRYKLQNAVVAFGDRTIEAVKPTTFSSQVTAAIRELPVDGSGIENVMTGVREVMDEYGRKWKGGMMIVVWTDESGDDILQLEETIHECRQRRAVVHVVGPTAVLGSERGRHHYVDRATGLAFLLPIKRGPDTCLPERLFIPYWWDSPLAPWIQDGVVAASGVPWYGGPHREGLLSGLGPYALTRLALETGGQFIALDREVDKSPFEPDVMRRYMPEYESADEYVERLNEHPLRKATSEAVQATYAVANLWPPSTQFILHRDTHYPFGIYSNYYTPPRFRELLKEELPKQLVHANAAADVIEQALAKFPATGMESEYAAERSLRWRAWYDVTRGRLLAMSVRTLEYRLACEKVWQAGFLQPDTNRINFEPSAEFLSGTVSEARAREARRLLTRCQSEHAGTPWEKLAEWELKHPLGVAIKQIAVKPPRPSPPGPPRPPVPVIKFPPL